MGAAEQVKLKAGNCAPWRPKSGKLQRPALKTGAKYHGGGELSSRTGFEVAI
jgi:hypothetical protein